MFSVIGSKIKHKKAIRNQTAVYFCLHHDFFFYKFLSIFVVFLLLWGLVSNIFKMFFRDSYSDFGYLTKNQKLNI